MLPRHWSRNKGLKHLQCSLAVVVGCHPPPWPATQFPAPRTRSLVHSSCWRRLYLVVDAQLYQRGVALERFHNSQDPRPRNEVWFHVKALQRVVHLQHFCQCLRAEGSRKSWQWEFRGSAAGVQLTLPPEGIVRTPCAVHFHRHQMGELCVGWKGFLNMSMWEATAKPCMDKPLGPPQKATVHTCECPVTASPLCSQHGDGRDAVQLHPCLLSLHCSFCVGLRHFLSQQAE